MIITEKEFNVITGEETIIEREATPDELAQHQAVQAEAALQATATATADTARTAAVAKLAKLGLTVDDLAALGL